MIPELPGNESNNWYDLDEQEMIPELPRNERQLASGEDEASYVVFMSDEDIKSGGFLFLLFGIIYCFYGISLATTHYINPSIDIIKKNGSVSSDTMNATLLAMSNSEAETFIIMNSIFFGVSDIGISTVVQQSAFYSLIT
eukprot:CAMPEP_0176356654 /NCGR_PEP_ID=MMETSP0126-20121128/14169_1 /TAXON_ID=141414 ORGANISM="Strombidinopsis acuminatum, Strain SPMC142" /NCGR_SAMPLE_ID=MMETSP0126 /ASSEMBLY_ACC=CAM_ASM_000229 /LENGTH=139 /DNA_ID=CAMNT_0017709837 /DNA_START=184 /DNA_END=603 /DNA_ORIENTATION=-